jgi:hypothetical protein
VAQVLPVSKFMTHVQGLELKRYNQTTAYDEPALDYIEDENSKFNYDSSKDGGNIWAVVQFDLTDMGEGDGGETVFPRSLYNDSHVPLATVSTVEVESSSHDLRTRLIFYPFFKAIEDLRKSGDAKFSKEGSWEEAMVRMSRCMF